ncbi:MAG: type II toxin-antitoxin system mRNA interferase toxin, RelE/StbE family [Nitrospirota bacterium]
MKVSFTKPFKGDYHALPKEIQELINKQTQELISKQIAHLMENPHHPSLRIKKMEGHESVWEARVTKGYRMTFHIHVHGDTCLLRRVGTHSILKRP